MTLARRLDAETQEPQERQVKQRKRGTNDGNRRRAGLRLAPQASLVPEDLTGAAAAVGAFSDGCEAAAVTGVAVACTGLREAAAVEPEPEEAAAGVAV